MWCNVKQTIYDLYLLIKTHNKLIYSKKDGIYTVFLSDSEAIRTLDPRLRRALLYPAELRNHPLIRLQR